MEVFEFLARTIGSFGIGFGIARIFNEDYKTASWVLLITSILFMINYLVIKHM